MLMSNRAIAHTMRSGPVSIPLCSSVQSCSHVLSCLLMRMAPDMVLCTSRRAIFCACVNAISLHSGRSWTKGGWCQCVQTFNQPFYLVYSLYKCICTLRQSMCGYFFIVYTTASSATITAVTASRPHIAVTTTATNTATPCTTHTPTHTHTHAHTFHPRRQDLTGYTFFSVISG